MAPTATKTKRDVPVDKQQEINDRLERFKDESRDRYAVQVLLLEACIERHDPDAIFSPSTLDLSVSEILLATVVFFGGRRFDWLEFCRLAERHRAIMQARAKSTPQVEAAAREKLAQAIAAENDARRDIEELDIEARPEIRSKITKLLRTADACRDNRVEAERALSAIEASKLHCRSAAPEFLVMQCQVAVEAVKRTNSTWRDLARLENEIDELERMVTLVTSPNIYPKDATFLNYCVKHLPDAVLLAAGKPEKIKADEFFAHVEWLRREELQRRRDELDRYRAAWQQIVDAIESPIRHWMATGEI